MFTKIILSATLLLPLTSFATPGGTVSNDGEIAKVLTTINDSEIDAAKLELSHGKNADVKAFAKTMS